MPQSVTFPKLNPRWLFDRACVQFFATLNGELVLKCLISVEALHAHFGAKDLSPEEAERAFLEHREEIEAVARETILKGHYKRGDEVLLRTADFSQEPSNLSPQHRPDHGLQTVIDPALSEQPSLLSGVNEAQSILERDLATGSAQVDAKWDIVRVPPDKPLARLTLTDTETGASAEYVFSAGDLANLNYTRFSLFRLWDELLRDRGRRQFESLQGARN